VVVAMMKILLAILVAAATTTPVSAQPPNPFSDRLQKLDELRRHAVLRRAVLDSGEQCKRVERAGINGRYKNLMMWSARCAPGGDYALFIGPDASVQVRSCKDVAKLGLPACRVPEPQKR
jgi:hypothetical protein